MKRKLLFLLLCLVSGAILCGCEKAEEELPLESIEYTLWEGTLTDRTTNVSLGISIAFGNAVGDYVVGNESSYRFSYRTVEGKFISVPSAYGENLLEGDWWVFEQTRYNLILKQNPLELSKTKVLTLTRIVS